MCVIASCKERQLTKEEFDNCFSRNSDGVGIAYFKNGKVHYEKGLMAFDEAWERYCKINTNKPHVVHFRIATSGGTIKELTHPFIIDVVSPVKVTYSGKKPLLFHNGCLSYSWKDNLLPYYIAVGKVPEGEISDSRFAAMLISRMGEEILKVLNNNNNGKFSVIGFTKNGKPFVRDYGVFEKADGIDFSNGSYKSCYYKASRSIQKDAAKSNDLLAKSYQRDWKERFNGYY